MKTLDDAWAWYTKNRHLLRLMSRLGGRYWNELFPEGSRLGKDDRFRHLEGVEVQRDANTVLDEFDDIAIFVLFSVFEASVRDRVKEDIEAEVTGLQHDALRRAAKRIVQNIEEGSFHANVLELSKDRDHDTVEEVNQIRKYRNWVAHGRRGPKPPTVHPRDALDRLKTFLEMIGPKPGPSS